MLRDIIIFPLQLSPRCPLGPNPPEFDANSTVDNWMLWFAAFIIPYNLECGSYQIPVHRQIFVRSSFPSDIFLKLHLNLIFDHCFLKTRITCPPNNELNLDWFFHSEYLCNQFLFWQSWFQICCLPNFLNEIIHFFTLKKIITKKATVIVGDFQLKSATKNASPF